MRSKLILACVRHPVIRYYILMSNNTQLVLYTGGVAKFPSQADGVSGLEWLDSVKDYAKKDGITGESLISLVRNRLDQGFSHVIESRLRGPLAREQHKKHHNQTFTWTFDKLSIAILKIEAKAKVPRTSQTVNNMPDSGGKRAAARKNLSTAAETAGGPAGTAFSHVLNVNKLRSAGFGANGIVKGSSAAMQHSQIGLATKNSAFAANQSLGMDNLAKTTYNAVGTGGVLALGAAVGLAGYALYQYATEEDARPQVPVTEYVWDYNQITKEVINKLARNLVEGD
ncbi:hypothetical protein B0H16DRAFT_1898624 [Mycena metata]|uniref:Uncharacterized protein n=1 Tax=Mycena metata TaxID=1033252 RepID=A0AAD7HAX4_9AGAR|nr:hypothetical protein B0H16DRAFT_1898624 [Mycena metata]